MPTPGLLSLPDEILLRVFGCVFEDVQPLCAMARPSKVQLGALCVSKRLREVAMQALVGSVAFYGDNSGVDEDNVFRFIRRQELWRYVRSVLFVITIRFSRRLIIATPIDAASLPVNPVRVKAAFNVAGSTFSSISWPAYFPFADRAVTTLTVAMRDNSRCDLEPALQAFPCLATLTIYNGTGTCLRPGGRYPSVRHFRDYSYHASNDNMRNVVASCPNLRTATVQASEASYLPAGIEDLALSLENSPDDDDLVQFQSLHRFASLRRLAFRRLGFGTGQEAEQCPLALRLIPITVRHLAFHETLYDDFLTALQPFVQDTQRLPDLETIFVSFSDISDPTAIADSGELKQACGRRGVRLGTADETQANWKTDPWLR
jgi:hypothetical protein